MEFVVPATAGAEPTAGVGSNPMLQRLWARVSRRTARVGVAGLRSGGLGWACGAAIEAGFCVTVVEPERERFAALRRGRSFEPGLPDHRVARLNNLLRHRIATGPAALADCDVLVSFDDGFTADWLRTGGVFLRRGALLLHGRASAADGHGPAGFADAGSGRLAAGRDFFLAWPVQGALAGAAADAGAGPGWQGLAGASRDCRAAAYFFCGAYYAQMVPLLPTA